MATSPAAVRDVERGPPCHAGTVHVLVGVVLLGVVLAAGVALGTTAPRRTSVDVRGVELIDAHRCSFSVCLDVFGEGEDVTEIATSTKQAGPYSCDADAVLFVNSIEVKRERQPCANGWTHYWTRPWAPRTYRDGDVICTTITTRRGTPCATIKAKRST